MEQSTDYQDKTEDKMGFPASKNRKNSRKLKSSISPLDEIITSLKKWKTMFTSGNWAIYTHDTQLRGT